MEASNDRELIAMLKPKIINGLGILGRDYIEPDIEESISEEVVGGTMYEAGGPGSVSQAWDTNTKSGEELGSVDVSFNPDLLVYGDGRHVGAITGEKIDDMMALLDTGSVGPLFGYDNPAMRHEGMWSRVVRYWEKGMRRKIISAFKDGGLDVW